MVCKFTAIVNYDVSIVLTRKLRIVLSNRSIIRLDTGKERYFIICPEIVEVYGRTDFVPTAVRGHRFVRARALLRENLDRASLADACARIQPPVKCARSSRVS